MNTFIKYQSIGNDFIIFDYLNQPEKIDKLCTHSLSWQQYVRKICNRHYGIGANGVLLLTKNHEASIPQIFIFNADGSSAELCLNGLRCIAHYLHAKHNVPKTFQIKMGSQIIPCQVNVDQKNTPFIMITISNTQYLGTKPIEIELENIERMGSIKRMFIGHVIDLGNPHLVIFEKTSIAWLQKHGKSIEHHPIFQNKTNVEFVWRQETGNGQKAIYNVLVHERGCGITLSCSSGAVAITTALYRIGAISTNEQFSLNMQGGIITCSLKPNNTLVLQAQAQPIYTGTLLASHDLQPANEKFRPKNPPRQSQMATNSLK